MSRKQTTDYEEWQEIGRVVKQVDRDVTDLVTLLNSVPKTVWNDQHDKALEGMTELKHVLEERMAEEHPEKWDPDVFYGADPPPTRNGDGPE